MSNAPLVGVKACVFDAYGTLFDFAAATKGCRDVLGDSIEKLTALWRDKQLQYTWLRAVQGRHADFWQVTGDALDFALQTLAIEQPGLRNRLMNLYLTLDAFPEVPDVLARLKQAGLPTAILSNGSPKMLDAAVKAAGLKPLLDAVLSVEEVGVYKPHPKVYQLAVDGSGCRLPPSRSNRRMRGTPTRPRHSGCRSYGAIATGNGRSDCRARPTER
jgi:2-haloacid dehalogenase